MSFTVVLLSLLLCYSCNAITAAPMIRFANYYQDHMVLQQAPTSAIVWGYIPSSCEEVNVVMDKDLKVQAKVTPIEKLCKWLAVLPAIKAGGPHTITASSASHGSVTITDVLFGDVWVCGGQSNMAFTLSGAFNATEEIAKAANYPNLRIITVGRELTDMRVDEPTTLSLNWSIPSQKTVPGFSAVCWLYGQNIYNRYKVPLGLISNNWGGTPDEAWSSPEALSNCPSNNQGIGKPSDFGDQKSPSALWNAMMYPFTQMTIYGAIWYQGEANSGNPSKYNCTFPAMISDWRKTWHERTQQTDPTFPFGFVQLAANGVANNTNNGFPGIRWSQTASYGYVPNPVMRKVFMAVAMDLGDPKSPHGSIHPRDKQDVGVRLALAGRVIAYGESASSVYYTGPLVDKATVVKSSAADIMSVTISFRDLAMSTRSLEKLRSPYGFEVGCTASGKTTFIEGIAKAVEGNSNVMVEFPMCPSGSTASVIRYAWRDDPCVFKTCAVYSGELPAPPFMMPLATA